VLRARTWGAPVVGECEAEARHVHVSFEGEHHDISHVPVLWCVVWQCLHKHIPVWLVAVASVRTSICPCYGVLSGSACAWTATVCRRPRGWPS
jgi:hypothetical protein